MRRTSYTSLPAPCRWDSGALHHGSVTNGQTMGFSMLHSGSTILTASDVPCATLLPVCSAVCCDCPRHDPGEASRYVLILLRRLNASQDLLDANANLLATGAFLDLPNSAIGVIESTRLLQDVCKFSLRVDIGYRNLSVEAAEQVELSKHGAFCRGREDQQATILVWSASLFMSHSH
jgi:hypothetical protein